MSDIVMPRLSDTMEEGTVLRWLKRDGEHVRRGEELVEIETDKATMTYESDQDGVLQTVAREGDTLPVGELIARVSGGAGGTAVAVPAGAGEAGGARGGATEAPGAGLPNAEPAAAPDAAEPSAAEPTAGAAQPSAESFVEAIAEIAGGGASSEVPANDSERVKASPLARRIARDRGVDLHALSGSGPGGRIVKADVETAGQAAGEAGDREQRGGGAKATGGAGAPARSEGQGPGDVMTAKGETSTVALSRTQQTIARRMAESKATIPDFSLQSDVDMEECVKLRGELKRISSREAPTYNDMVVKAAALALREHPRANGSYRDGNLQLHSRVNVGVAVAAGDALVVPTVFDADEKSLGEIAREARALAGRVREGTITPPELGGGTFTVSNLGMYGVRSFTAIINPPQAAILSVGSVEQRAVVRDGELLARHAMTLTLVCDHRILYGADGAELLARIRELLQAPVALTL